MTQPSIPPHEGTTQERELRPVSLLWGIVRGIVFVLPNPAEAPMAVSGTLGKLGEQRRESLSGLYRSSHLERTARDGLRAAAHMHAPV